MRQRADILIFVGPSGTGKSTLISELKKKWPGVFGFSISHTTRKPREGEVNGQHYHFVSHDEFFSMVSADEFVEYSCVYSKDHCAAEGVTAVSVPAEAGDYYGTSNNSLKDALTRFPVVLMDTDIVGTMKIKKLCEHEGPARFGQRLRSLAIFVQCTSIEVLEKRLQMRGTETRESLQRRMRESEKWLEWYAANPNSFDYVLLNDHLETCFAELVKYVSRNVLVLPSLL